jgi:xanthine dehydrogenase YagT iron-sulfur-binding subunit
VSSSQKPDRQKSLKSAFSRRGFIQGIGIGGGAVGSGALASVAAAAPAGVVGPAAVAITLQINGKPNKLTVEPRVTLLDALRDYLDVTGCKRVCDRGTCGACTVMVNGTAIFSCTMLAVEAQGKSVKTAEALNADGKLDAVPAAFAHYDAQQCGFCTPGFVVSMRAAFDKNPKATSAEIEEALSGNICRCGTYEQMRHAIAKLCGTNDAKGG